MSTMVAIFADGPVGWNDAYQRRYVKHRLKTLVGVRTSATANDDNASFWVHPIKYQMVAIPAHDVAHIPQLEGALEQTATPFDGNGLGDVTTKQFASRTAPGCQWGGEQTRSIIQGRRRRWRLVGRRKRRSWEWGIRFGLSSPTTGPTSQSEAN